MPSRYYGETGRTRFAATSTDFWDYRESNVGRVDISQAEFTVVAGDSVSISLETVMKTQSFDINISTDILLVIATTTKFSS